MNPHKLQQWCAILFGIVILWVLPTSAACPSGTCYVDRDVSCPGAGTTGDPYCSIQNAFDVVDPGDSIRIRDSAGPYDQNATLTRSGSAGNVIIIEPDVGHTPTITASGGQDAAAIRTIDVDYVTIQNLTWDGDVAVGADPDDHALWIDASSTVSNNVSVLNNTFQNWCDPDPTSNQNMFALLVGDSNDQTIAVHVEDLLIQGNLFDANCTRSATSFGAVNLIFEENEIRNSRCGFTSFEGGTLTNVGFKADGSDDDGSGVIMRHNYVHDFDTEAACSAGGEVKPTIGLWCDTGSTDGQMVRNYIRNIGNTASDPGSVGLQIEARCHGWLVDHNVISQAAWPGMKIRLANNTVFTHNTVYDAGRGLFLSSGANSTWKNNISADSKNSQLHFDIDTQVAGGHTLDYNLYFDTDGDNIGFYEGVGHRNLTQWQTSCNCDANSIDADPVFRDAANGDFALQASSNAIGAGELGATHGAFTPPLFATAATNVAGDEISVTFSTPNTPLQHDGACNAAAWTLAGTIACGSPTITACDIGAANEIVATPSCSIVSGDIFTITYNGATGDIFDSANIGTPTNEWQQALLSFTESVTNNAGAGGGAVLTGKTCRAVDWTSTIDPPVWYGAEQSPTDFVRTTSPRGTLMVRCKVANTVAAAAGDTYRVFVSKNGGAYSELLDTCITGTACFVQDHPLIPSQTVIDTERLTAVGTFIDGGFADKRLASPFIAWSTGSESADVQWTTQFASDVVPGTDEFCFRLYDGAGLALGGGYDVTPCLRVVEPSLGWSGEVVLSGAMVVQ